MVLLNTNGIKKKISNVSSTFSRKSIKKNKVLVNDTNLLNEIDYNSMIGTEISNEFCLFAKNFVVSLVDSSNRVNELSIEWHIYI